MLWKASLIVNLKRQQNYNIKYQDNSRKELLKSHVLKQTKPTRKRMKQTLKKSQRLLAGKPCGASLASLG